MKMITFLKLVRTALLQASQERDNRKNYNAWKLAVWCLFENGKEHRDKMRKTNNSIRMVIVAWTCEDNKVGHLNSNENEFRVES